MGTCRPGPSAVILDAAGPVQSRATLATEGRGGMTDAAAGAGHSGAAGHATAAPVVQLPTVVAAEHHAAVAALRESYAALSPEAPVRLAKRTSNLFRFREPAPRAPGRRAAPRMGSAAG